MSDETLIAEQLERAANEDDLIENFDRACLEGASYDFRAGEHVIRARPDANQYENIALDAQGSITIEPGYAYLFKSYEQVNLPEDIKGRLSLRSRLANQKLLYSGGLIDPGFEGQLYFTLFNLGTGTYEVAFKEEMVTGEFIRIKPTKTYQREGDGADGLSKEKYPPLPQEEQKMRDWEEMNRELTEHERKIERLRDHRIDDLEDRVDDIDADVANTRDLVNNLILAAIASLFAGVGAAITLRLLSWLF